MTALARNQITAYVLDRFEPPVDFLARHHDPRRATIDAALRVARDLGRLRPHQPEEVDRYVLDFLGWERMKLDDWHRDEEAERGRVRGGPVAAVGDLVIWRAGGMVAFQAPETPPLFREFGKAVATVHHDHEGRLDRFGRWVMFPAVCQEPFSPTAVQLAAERSMFGFTLNDTEFRSKLSD